MSHFVDGSDSMEYYCEDQILTEVEVGDDPIPDDESVWTDMNEDNVEELQLGDEAIVPVMEGDVVDLSIYSFRGHTDSVYAIAVHPKDPTLVLTGGGDDRAFLWTYSLPTGERAPEPIQLHELSGHTDSITSVGFNFDGTLAMTAAYDGIVRIWDVATGECKQILEGPEDIEWAKWHGKGNAVIAGSGDGTIWMWMATDGQCMQVFAGHDGGVSSGCFTNDGKMVLSGGEDGTVRVWNPKSGQCKHVFEGHFGHEGTVTCVESSADGELALTGSIDGKVRLFQISGKKALLTLTHFVPENNANGANGASAGGEEDYDEIMSVEAVGFCNVPGLPLIASAGMDGNLKIWDHNSGQLRCVCPHREGISALRWHSSLPIVATSSVDRTVRLFDARTGTLLLELTGHTAMVVAFEIKTLNKPIEIEGNMYTDEIVSVSDDKTAKVFFYNTH